MSNTSMCKTCDFWNSGMKSMDCMKCVNNSCYQRLKIITRTDTEPHILTDAEMQTIINEVERKR
jgi:hypothetical protein